MGVDWQQEMAMVLATRINLEIQRGIYFLLNIIKAAYLIKLYIEMVKSWGFSQAVAQVRTSQLLYLNELSYISMYV